jgi:EAL domain-containing protein (putative c-di-GMP-specific phosphodiesterase class I)
MIYFEDLPLDEDILKALGELSINYVFQSIFYPDGKTIFAREALMRPLNMTVTELIEKYAKEDKLHVLEVATFFGAMQEYQLRGYTDRVCFNSFPSEAFTPEESKAFSDYYGDQTGLGIIEILEYPRIEKELAEYKSRVIRSQDLWIAVDDFGAGLNDYDVVEMYDPHMVKIDRELLSDVDSVVEKQENLREVISNFHEKGIKVVAEGVETKGEFDWLVDAGADFFQGFYLHRPE